MVHLTQIYPLGLFLSCLLVLSCGGDQVEYSSPEVAHFKNKVLSQEQLQFYVPDGINQEDSVRYAKQFIDQWITEQAVCEKALDDYPELAKEIDYKVQDYRAKLITHEYHNLLVEKSMDTNISFKEIAAYYEENKDNFLSKEKLYGYFYLVTTENPTSEVISWMKSNDPSSLEKLRNWASKYAREAKLDSAYSGETRINQISKGYFGNLQKVPLGKLIRWNSVMRNERRRYMFRMIRIIQSGDHLPLHLCEEKIRSLLTNQRKVNLIEDTEQKIVNDAKERNDIGK